MNTRTLSAAVFAAVLLVSVAGCKKKAPAPAPPPPAPPPKVEEPPKPPAVRIDSFTAEPRSIERGQSATLRWSVANATDISIDQNVGAVQANGTRQVFPSDSTTYTLAATGPGGTDSRSVTVDVSSPPPPPPPKAPPPKISGAEMLGREAQDAYFDYDKSDIREDARQVLTRDADLLKRIFAGDPNFTVVIEGHCDERGSAEYNLGLGDRRATAAKDFLVQLGVPSDRLKTISYGKERPVCTEANEECYQRNRRAHLSPGQ
ncbi:MAG: peptidoglycan-associated lipoprotein Pal [Acidobacteria bacterium]|nr:MAG: peptidoglycan-associated lipoprotein Pal [Acidobacteriota bacterium]